MLPNQPLSPLPYLVCYSSNAALSVINLQKIRLLLSIVFDEPV